MAYIAEVIVDVPTMQTDQPFTYLIPSELQAAIETGMRVEVPFGKGDRHIQGSSSAFQKLPNRSRP